MAESTPSEPNNRYRGIGGTYVVVDGEVCPADEAGKPLPHFLDASGAPLPAKPASIKPAAGAKE